MEIIVAETAGFCFGVKRAIRIALEAAEEGTICSLGPLIHNNREVHRLSDKGIIPVASMDELIGNRVIIRSHGVPPCTEKELTDRGFTVIDVTCPFVKKAQKIAEASGKESDLTVIVGDKNHPEVLGLMGYAGCNSVAIGSLKEARSICFPGKVSVLSQTTRSQLELDTVVEYINSVAEDVDVHNTICKATGERQKEIADIAGMVDAVLVIGDKNSANTTKLATIAGMHTSNVAIIENYNDINSLGFNIWDAQKIGITAGASTPDWIIREVLEKLKEDTQMEEQLNEVEVKEEAIVAEEAVVEENPEMGMEEALEAYDKDITVVRRGERLSGKIIKVTDSELLVDIGAKSEGIIPRNELTPSEAENLLETFQVGDELEVIVLRKENEDGHPVLSKKRVDADIAWEKLVKAMEANEVLEGKVLDVVKGGLLVDCGLKGFVPASLVEMGFANQLDKYKDQTIQFKIIECDKSHNKLILSRKAFLEQQKAEKAEQIWAEIEKGQVRRGVVQRLVNFGAFIDLDGVDGLLHVSQMAWYRVNHPSELLKIGDEIDVYVLNVDTENRRISLGLKQLSTDPWTLVPDNYPVDAVVEAKVVRTAAFGAFVQLEPGVEGLVHISQLAWGRVAKTEDAVKPGDVVNVKVLGFDLDSKKISLSIKETTEKPAPEEAPAEEAKEEAPAEKEPTYEPQEEAAVTIGDIVNVDDQEETAE